MTRLITDFEVTRDEQEISLHIEAEGEYEAAEPASLHFEGAPEGGYVEITLIALDDEPWQGTFTEAETARLEERLMELLLEKADGADDGGDE